MDTKFIYNREEYTTELINEGLLTGSFENPKLSEKDGLFGGYNLAKIKNFGKVRSIKKLLNNYVKTAEELMIKEFDAMSDDDKKTYAGPLITMQKEEGDDEGEKDENKEGNADAAKKATEQAADEEKRKQEIEKENADLKKSKTMTSSLRLSDASKGVLDKMKKELEQTISSVKDDQIKEWAKMMFTAAETIIAEDFIEHIKTDNKDEMKSQIDEINNEQEKNAQKVSQQAEKEETKKKKEELETNKEEIEEAEISTEDSDLVSTLKNLSEPNSDLSSSEVISKIMEDIKKFGGELSDDTMRGICKTCSDAFDQENSVLSDKEISDEYKSAYQNALLLCQAVCCCSGETVDSFIADESFDVIAKLSLTDGGYDEKISTSFQNAVDFVSKNPVYNGGTKKEIDTQSKTYKSNVKKIAKSIKKKGEEIASKLEQENGAA